MEREKLLNWLENVATELGANLKPSEYSANIVAVNGTWRLYVGLQDWLYRDNTRVEFSIDREPSCLRNYHAAPNESKAGVSFMRDPETVAKDIKRRLLPQAIVYLSKEKELHEQDAKWQSEWEALDAYIQSQLPPPQGRHQRSLWQPDLCAC